MLLKDYITLNKNLHRNIFFSGIAFNSSKVKKNNIFFALKGNKYDGNNYIAQAIKKGAKVIISENKIVPNKKENVLFLRSLNVRKLLSKVSYKIFSKKPKTLVGVTGTNGKSSIADFYYQILDYNFKSVASIGTIGVRYGKRKIELNNTTLDPIHLSSILKNLKKKKLKI